MSRQQVELKKYHIPMHQRILNINDIETSYNMFHYNMKNKNVEEVTYCLSALLETAIEIVISHGIEQNFEDFLINESNIEIVFGDDARQKYIYNKLDRTELINFWSEIISWTLNKIEAMKCEVAVLTEIEEKYSID
jgi:hypothetical protein